MSGQYIPKEQLTAYERWEVAAFDEAERLAKTMRDAEAAAPVAPPAPPEDDAVPPAETVAPAISEEELAAIRQRAFDEGRAAGFEEGLKSGYGDGYSHGESQVKTEGAQLAALARNFNLSIDEAEEKLAEALLTLALDVAAQVLRTALKTRPELMLPVVREAIAALANPHGHPSLLLNPEDAALVRQQLGEQLAHSGWRIFEDARIARGGCRIENAGAEIDASVATRWQRIVEQLGQQSDWLA